MTSSHSHTTLAVKQAEEDSYMNQRLAYQLGGIGVGLIAMVYACISSRHARLSRISREAHIRKFDTDADSDDSALPSGHLFSFWGCLY